jgi:hypothetical protein
MMSFPSKPLYCRNRFGPEVVNSVFRPWIKVKPNPSIFTKSVIYATVSPAMKS